VDEGCGSVTARCISNIGQPSRLFQLSFIPIAQQVQLPMCSARFTRTAENTHRKRRDEDEAAFENQRRACRDVFARWLFSRRPRLRRRLKSTIAALILPECEVAAIPVWSNARRWLPAGAPIVTRIHSRRAPAPKRAAAARRPAAPMPISRSTRLRKARGSRLSTNRTATARSID
jgi:hypothetical protein